MRLQSRLPDKCSNQTYQIYLFRLFKTYKKKKKTCNFFVLCKTCYSVRTEVVEFRRNTETKSSVAWNLYFRIFFFFSIQNVTIQTNIVSYMHSKTLVTRHHVNMWCKKYVFFFFSTTSHLKTRINEIYRTQMTR